MGELRQIPGVGKETEQDLIAIGYPTIDSLRGANPEDLYQLECVRKGEQVDRCVSVCGILCKHADGAARAAFVKMVELERLSRKHCSNCCSNGKENV